MTEVEIRKQMQALLDTDAILIAIGDGKPVTLKMLAKLPPWRAYLVAKIATKAGLYDVNMTLDLFKQCAASVGGDCPPDVWQAELEKIEREFHPRSGTGKQT